MPTGKMEESIVITNDNQYNKIESYGQNRDYMNMSKEKSGSGERGRYCRSWRCRLPYSC